MISESVMNYKAAFTQENSYADFAIQKHMKKPAHTSNDFIKTGGKPILSALFNFFAGCPDNFLTKLTPCGFCHAQS